MRKRPPFVSPFAALALQDIDFTGGRIRRLCELPRVAPRPGCAAVRVDSKLHGMGQRYCRIRCPRCSRAKAVLGTLLVLASGACVNHSASGVRHIQPTAAAMGSSAHNLSRVPVATGGAPSTLADAGGTESPAPAASQSPNAEHPETTAATQLGLLPWLVGRWKGKHKTCWPLTWSERNEMQARQRNRCTAAGVRFDLDLTFTESPGKLDGLLEAVAQDERRHKVVGFVIAQGKAGCSLVWTEGGIRYGFSYESGSAAPACMEENFARFSLKRGPTSRIPYPIVIEFWIQDHELRLRRAHGPQHGAAVDVIYTFER